MKRLAILLLIGSPAAMAQLPQDIKCRLGGPDDQPIVCKGIEFPPQKPVHRTLAQRSMISSSRPDKPQAQSKAEPGSKPRCRPNAPEDKGINCEEASNTVVTPPTQPNPNPNLPDKPEPRLPQDSSSKPRCWPSGPDGKGITCEGQSTLVTKPKELVGGELIPDGMVWVPNNGFWEAREMNSCEWCGRPLTFRQAAFDRKALVMWGAAVGLAVADTELAVSRPCFKAQTCGEGNPLLANGRKQYAVRLPVLFAAWMGTAWLRKGDKSLKIGGMKHWYLFPLVYQGGPVAGIVANLARR